MFSSTASLPNVPPHHLEGPHVAQGTDCHLLFCPRRLGTGLISPTTLCPTMLSLHAGEHTKDQRTSYCSKDLATFAEMLALQISWSVDWGLSDFPRSAGIQAPHTQGARWTRWTRWTQAWRGTRDGIPRTFLESAKKRAKQNIFNLSFPLVLSFSKRQIYPESLTLQSGVPRGRYPRLEVALALTG